MRAAAAVLLTVALTAACGHAGCDTSRAASAGSCAGDIAVGVVHYVPGRGDGAPPLPGGGRALHATLLPCADGCTPSTAVIAHAIPGIPVSDAVAGPVADELMLAERLWEKPRSELPAALQPYVAR